MLVFNLFLIYVSDVKWFIVFYSDLFDIEFNFISLCYVVFEVIFGVLFVIWIG